MLRRDETRTSATIVDAHLRARRLASAHCRRLDYNQEGSGRENERDVTYFEGAKDPVWRDTRVEVVKRGAVRPLGYSFSIGFMFDSDSPA